MRDINARPVHPKLWAVPLRRGTELSLRVVDVAEDAATFQLWRRDKGDEDRLVHQWHALRRDAVRRRNAIDSFCLTFSSVLRTIIHNSFAEKPDADKL